MRRFLEERTLVVGQSPLHRTVIDHKEAVPFVSGLLALPEQYGIITSAKNEYNTFIREGFVGELESESFENY